MLLGSGDGGMFPDKRPLCAVRLHRAVARPQRGPQPLAGARRNAPPGALRDAEQLTGHRTPQDGSTMGSRGWLSHGAKAATLLPSST